MDNFWSSRCTPALLSRRAAVIRTFNYYNTADVAMIASIISTECEYC